MCTATWVIAGDGYELFFNRDESRSRLPAEGPVQTECAGVRYLAPTDADAGGTWIAVNEHGLGLGLLNATRDASVARRESEVYVSRGRLIRDLADCATVADLGRRLDTRDLHVYRGFRLLALEARGEIRVWAWNGRELTAETVQTPLCSSSLGSEQALVSRRPVLAALTLGAEPSPAVLDAFHRSHDPARGPWSVCMHRDDARTVSASHIRVDAASVRFRYAAGPPCRTAFGPALGLPRRRESLDVVLP